jgi:hypothetical protein
MAQQANLTVFDGAATPVSHTLLAVSITRENGVIKAQWRENTSGVPVEAQIRASMSLQQRTNSGVYQVDAVVEVPVMETIGAQNSAGYTAAPKVAYVNTYKTQGLFHPRSDTVGRRLARQLMINLLGNVTTSVAAATSGPFPDVFDNLIPVS